MSQLDALQLSQFSGRSQFPAALGQQYRSGIWYVNDTQKRAAGAYIKELEAQDRYGGREIVTQLEPAQTFWPAEEYHQDYIAKTARPCHVKNPW